MTIDRCQNFKYRSKVGLQEKVISDQVFLQTSSFELAGKSALLRSFGAQKNT